MATKLRVARALSETREALPGHRWNVIDYDLPDDMAPEATRQLCRLVVLALIGEKHYREEVGTGGDDLDLVYDLTWAAEHYAAKATEQKAGAA